MKNIQLFTIILFIALTIGIALQHAQPVFEIISAMNHLKTTLIGNNTNAQATIRKLAISIKNDPGEALKFIPDIVTTFYGIFTDIKRKLDLSSFRTTFVEINGAFAKIVGIRKLNGIIKLDNGHLAYSLAPKQNKKTLDRLLNNTVAFGDFLQSQSLPFLYVQLPYKIPLDTHNSVCIDYSNHNANYMVTGLQNKSINVFDVRKAIIKDRLNHYDLFFKTDHHWKPEAAFWTHNKILDQLELILDYRFNNEYKNIENYQTHVYASGFLGSLGKRTGSIYAKPDDFTLIKPLFETHFTVHIPSENKKTTGNFEEVFLAKYRLKDKRDTYLVYFGDNPDYTQIYNHLYNHSNINGKKLLLIKDSFSLPLAAFLAPHFSEIHMVDLRGKTKKDLHKKILKTVTPDMVMVAYNPSLITSAQEAFEL